MTEQSKKQKYVDQETGKTLELTPGEYAQLASVPNTRGGGPRFTPTSGVVEVFEQDRNGHVHIREMDVDAYWASTARGEPIELMGDLADEDRALLSEAQEAGRQQRIEQLRADEAGVGEVFLDNLIPGARSISRFGLTDEQSARHARIQELEDDAHPVAAGLGDAGQLVATSLIPIPRLLGVAQAAKESTGLRTIKRTIDEATSVSKAVRGGAEVSEAQLASLGSWAERAEAIAGIGIRQKGPGMSAVEGLVNTATRGNLHAPARTAAERIAEQKARQAVRQATAEVEHLSALSLLGFGKGMGDIARAELALRGASGLPAQIAGSVAGGAVINLPLAIQYEAAQSFDYDKPLASEAFMQDVGTDMLLGLAVDAILPVAGRALRATATALPLMHVMGNLGGAAKKGRKLLKTAGVADSMLPPAKSKAQRTVAKEAIDEGAKRTELHRNLTAQLKPGNAYTPSGTKKVGAALTKLEGLTPSIRDLDEFTYLRENFNDLAGVSEAVVQSKKQNPSLIDRFNNAAEMFDSHAADMSLSGISFSGQVDRKLFKQEALVALRDADAALPGNPIIQEALSTTATAAGSPAEIATRLINLRNRTLIKAAGGDVSATEAAGVLKEHIDAVLTRPEVTGAAVEDLATILGASEDLIAGAQALREANNLRSIEDLLLPEQIDTSAFRAALQSVDGAYGRLGNRGALKDGKSLGFGQREVGYSRAALEKAEPKLRATQAANRVRAHSEATFERTLAPAPPSTAANVVTAGVEALGGYFKKLKDTTGSFFKGETEVATKRLAAASAASWAAYDNGVWKYRNMKTLDEKRASFESIRGQLQALTADPDTLQRAVEAFTKQLQNVPELAQTTAYNTLQKLQYLANQLPQAPQGMVGQDNILFSPSEMSAYLEIYGAADDPLSVLQTVGTGTLSDDALKTVAALYPSTYADMQVSLAEEIAKNREAFLKLPFAVRSDMDRFLGGGYIQSNQPSTFVHFQNRSAQTSGQQQALRGGNMNIQQRPTASDRLSNL